MVPPRDPFCLLDAVEGSKRLGIIGASRGLDAVLALTRVREGLAAEILSPLHLVAVCGPELPLLPELPKSVGRHPDWRTMLAAHPDINLVVELTGSLSLARELWRELPEDVALVDHRESFLLCALEAALSACAYCTRRVHRQRNTLFAVLDELEDDVLVLDLKGRVVDANESVVRKSGRTRKELVGKPCWQVQKLAPGVPFCIGDNPGCPRHAATATGKKAECLETRVGPDGHLRYYRVYAYPVRGDNGEVRRVVVMRRDITERTLREKGEAKAQRRDMISRLSAYLAHEIRNPLFAISGFARQLGNNANLDDKSRQKASIILEEAARLETVLAGILNFARPVEAAADEFDLSELAADAVQAVIATVRPTGVDVITHFDLDIPQVRGERSLVMQCVTNLVTNAVEAMPQGGKLTVSTMRCEDKICLEISDSGVGMPAKDLEECFSPFYTTKTKGYGMGLALVKKVMDDLGGGVEIRSQLGFGTTVRLSLPPV